MAFAPGPNQIARRVFDAATESVRTTLAAGSGLATETTLAAINTKLVQLALDFGSPTGALRTAAIIGNSSGIADFGSGAVSSQTLRVAIGSGHGLALESTLAALEAKFNSLGQKTMAGSAPVVIASDQSSIPVSQSGTWNVNNISGTVSLPTGASTLAEQQTQTTALQLIDDSIHGMNATFNKAVAIAGQCDDSSPTNATENMVAPVRISLERSMHVELRTGSAEVPIDIYLATLASAVIGEGEESALTYQIGAKDFITGTSEALTVSSYIGGAALHSNLRDSSGTERGTSGTPLFTRGSDGSNLTPAMDAAARAGFQKITDGTNTMPTMDVGARSGFQKIFDASGVYNVGQIVISSGGIGIMPMFLIDSANNFARFKSTGEFPAHAGSTNNTLANSTYLKTLSDGTVLDRSADTHYETVAASQTDQIMGATGAVGDYLKRVIISVNTAATGTVSIKDGNGAAIALTAANTPIGVYTVDVGALTVNATTPGWKITTGAGATAIGIGRFT